MPRTMVGSRWQPELEITNDPVSGARVTQLTSYKGHSNHTYFTYPGWIDKGRKILISSDRENRRNLYSVDLNSGEIVQLTDLDPAEGEPGNGVVNKVRNEVYFRRGKALLALDLESLAYRKIFTTPDGYVGGNGDATADGRYVVVGVHADLSDRIMLDLGHGYVGFKELWEAHPHSMIYKIDLDSGDTQVIYEEDSWLGHFNASPSQPGIMTFCHEGPWHLVDNRIWGLDINSGKAWKIRPTESNEMVGHEYWMPDGIHIGYHGRVNTTISGESAAKGGPIYGSIAYDNTDQVEAPFEYNSWHNHSYNLDLVVGDGRAENPYLLLWRYRNGQFEGPKVLAWHRGSFHTQQVHVHPCFSPDGKYILYTADPQGYGQVFMVDIPEFDSLPDRASLP